MSEDLSAYGEIAMGEEEEQETRANAQDPNAVPAFISKLLAMINDPSTNHLISWREDGETFIVHNASALAREVLPKYYKHNNFTSLVRQLNMYGFHKVMAVDQGALKSQADQNVWEFIHPCVHRDKPELLPLVKRKDATAQQKKKLMKHDVDSVVAELHVMRSQHGAIASKFQEMESQNTALWNEVLQLRQKHHQQQMQISKIMQFLKRLSNHYAPVTQPEAAAVPDRKRSRLAIDTLPVIEEPKSEEPGTDAASGASGMDMLGGDASGPQGAPQLYVEHLTPHIGMQHIDDRLHMTRQRLANGGMDPSVLAGIYNISAADAMAAGIQGLQPAQGQGQGQGQGLQPALTFPDPQPEPVAPAASPAPASRPPALTLNLPSVPPHSDADNGVLYSPLGLFLDNPFDESHIDPLLIPPSLMDKQSVDALAHELESEARD